MTYPPPNYTPPAPEKKRKWPKYLAIGAGVFVLVVACNAAVNDERATSTPVPTFEPQSQPVADPAPAAPAAPPAPVKAEGIGGGLKIVGKTIEPGLYQTSGAEPGIFELCYWATHVGPSSNSDVIDFGTASVDEPTVVQIDESVGSFDSKGCNNWERVE